MGIRLSDRVSLVLVGVLLVVALVASASVGALSSAPQRNAPLDLAAAPVGRRGFLLPDTDAPGTILCPLLAEDSP